MTEDEENVILKGSFEEIFQSEEYEVLSSHDLLLMSEKGHELQEIQSVDKKFDNQLISSIHEYEEEWNELFDNEEVDLDKLKQNSTAGLLRTSHFRSVCWRCLLGILHKQPKQWLCQLQMYRKHYDEICTELEQNPWNVKGSNPYDNPLSQESDSIWQKYFCDEELKAVVLQDVKRTFPGIDFFRQDNIQQMMVRVLFCYARQNPALCYRQGMHEILAPLIFILHCDHQSFLHAKEQKLELNKNLGEILNPEYLEQDAYSLFKYVMNHVECSYRISNVMTTAAGYFPPDCEKLENKFCQNELICRLDFIKENIFHPKDQELSDHLQKLNIPLHLFGIRWLRLLFGREFNLQDLLVLWDFIFAYNFETVNFIVVAMLVAVRHMLLRGDYTDCLSNLMRYPSGVDVTYIVQNALHLKDPQLYPPPDESKKYTFTYLSSKDNVNSGTQSQSDKSPKKGVSRTQWFLGKSNLETVTENGDGYTYICPGYSIDDPDYLRKELDDAKLIISTAHHKLVQFYSILRHNHENNIGIDVQDVLDEIYGLSCLLKSHKYANWEIETACEAGETKEPKVTNIDSTKVENVKPSIASVNSDLRSHTLPKMKRYLKSGELKVFKQHVGGAVSGAPMADPLHLIKS